MTKEDLSDEILAAMAKEDWALLEGKASEIPVSAHNRAILLKLRDCDADFDDEIDESKVQEAKERLDHFLKETWADQPLAHKYVIYASLAQAFIFEKPMHPWKTVRYFTRVADGEIHYYCSFREEGSVCEYCPAERMDDLNVFLNEKLERTQKEFGERSVAVQKIIFDTGFSDCGVIPTEQIHFYDDIRKMCESNQCRRYGTTWACPPAVGTIEECREKALSYRYMQLFSKVYKLTDSLDFEGVREGMADFKDLVIELGHRLEGTLEKKLILSNESCDRCKECTYPDQPCRFPEDLHPSIEGFGFYVSELASEAGLRYTNGASTVTYFGAVFY